MSTRPHSTRRSKSAKARLTPTEPMKPKQDLSQSAKERAEFALLNREKNESSKKVFPRPSSGDKKERYRTIYNKDFEGSFITPLEPRPTSPTRRNNPHPSKVIIFYTIQKLIAINYCSNLWYGEYHQERLVFHLDQGAVWVAL